MTKNVRSNIERVFLLLSRFKNDLAGTFPRFLKRGCGIRMSRVKTFIKIVKQGGGTSIRDLRVCFTVCLFQRFLRMLLLNVMRRNSFSQIHCEICCPCASLSCLINKIVFSRVQKFKDFKIN